MEIEIPQADQDAGTDGQLTDGTDGHLTDRTDGQTGSDGWSHEGRVSSSALTSRSFAHSRVSQPLSSQAPDDGKDLQVSMENGGLEMNSSANNTEVGMLEDMGTSSVKNPGRGRECGIFEEDANYRSTRLAAEDATVRYLAALSQGVGSQEREGEGEQAVDDKLEQKAAENELEQRDAEIKQDQRATEMESTAEMDAELKASEGAFGSEPYSTEPNLQGAGDGEGDQNEEGFSSGDGASNQPDEQGGNGSEADSKTMDHNFGSGFMTDAEDYETPRDVEQSQDDEMGMADSGKPSPGAAEAQQSRVFITESNQAGDEGSDISDVRAATPDWEEEGEENDGASVSDVCGVSQKHCPSSAASRPRPLTRSTLHEDIAPGHRAVVNTPVSYIHATDFNTEVIRNMESRNTSHAGLEAAREAAFQRAMTLMTNRCDSKQRAVEQGGLFSFNLDASYGPKCPQYFYVQQRKPAPMAPLKAWRGYHGNVYFEPMQIMKVGADKDGATEGSQKATPSIASHKSSGSRRRTATSAGQSQALVPVDNEEERQNVAIVDARSPTRSTTRLTVKRGPSSAKSRASSRSVAAVAQHHVLYLDKQAVINPDNTAMHEELQIIEKQHSTGSLNIQQRGHFPSQPSHSRGGPAVERVQARSGSSSAKFDRICKGSVVHTLRRTKSGGPLGNSVSGGRGLPGCGGNRETVTAGGGGLVVVGDRFAPPPVMSPLLRTQTQYSLSSQRMTMNSPDLYGAFERLPPLEQVRISLRHMDAHSDDTYTTRGPSPYSTGTSVGVVEELKPFIKYSPDVKAQYGRQIKYY